MKYIYVARILLVVALGFLILGAITQLEFLEIIAVLLNIVSMVLALISFIKGEK